MGRLLVAARYRRVSDPTPILEEQGAILVLNRQGSVLETWRAPFALRDLHGIAWYEGALWAACSHDDLVAIRLPDGSWRRWWPLGAPPEGVSDRFHFNSLWFEDGLVWVLAHRRGPSQLLAFPIAAALAGQAVAPLRQIELGIEAHDIWQLHGTLCTCSSAEGCLLSEAGWRLEVGGFTRGLARIPGGWAVGVSELAERQARDWTTGQVVVFDEDWREVRRYSLLGEGLILAMLWVDPEGAD
ncbi:hypothetical protein GWK36_00930 [Caldichromatium japonicum]|uniref:Uncharacterized protein n=1 Tax=Caldichromatium japonicum TaxID=2699430 RepID=A0A6G7VAA4_9GAMM|nr:hypothetical protein [Caldichromatium japonicum]QIK36796.1 hypothetical protein GWK36_00930 [Caldichromatium japonicum]